MGKGHREMADTGSRFFQSIRRASIVCQMRFCGRILILLAKVTDDMFIAGLTTEIKSFIDHICGRFPISKSIVNNCIKFNGCDITQDEQDNIKISMEASL